jgi:ribosomal protein L37AE/L43A
MKPLNWIFKWLLTIMLALVAGLLVIIFLSSRPELTPFLLRLILLAMVTLVGGLSARLFFRGMPTVFAILLSIVSSLFAVLTLDHFYATAYQFVFLSSNFHFVVPTVADGAQFLLMILVTLLPLLIFRRKTKSVSNQPKPARSKKTQITFSEAIKPVLVKADPRNWTIWKKGIAKPQKQKTTRSAKVEREIVSVPRPSTVISSRQPLTVRTSAVDKPAKKKLKLPGNIFKGSSSDVKLVGAEEHVCPYCLEEVVKDDSRGVVVCHECGTWHHQDCWDLTGSCGVAHRNEL